MDVALHKCGVTFVLDRAGVTGDDGASHNGMWDMSILQVVPGLRIAAPRDAATLREELREAVEVEDAPTVRAVPQGSRVRRHPGAGARRRGRRAAAGDESADVLLVAVGAMAETCLEVAIALCAQGIGVTVVDPRWVKPVPAALADMARDHRLRRDGRGQRARRRCRRRRSRRRCATPASSVPLRDFGIPARFLDHGKRAEVLAEIGLTAQDIARDVVETVSSLDRTAERHTVND